MTRQHTHLVRMDYARAKGWVVRLPRWHPEGPAVTYFADSKYGRSNRKALNAAIECRDRAFKQYGLELLAMRRTRGKRFELQEAVGLSFMLDERTRGRLRWSWLAYWSTEAGQHRRTFSTSKRGFAKALELAVKAREKGSGVRIADEPLLNTALIALLRMRERGHVPT